MLGARVGGVPCPLACGFVVPLRSGGSALWLRAEAGVALRLVLKMATLTCPLGVGSLLPLRSVVSAFCFRAEAGVAARRPPHFLCFAKESKQRKATRSQGHFVVPCAARARGVPAKLAALKQTRGLIPLALRCSALPHGASGIGSGRACERTDEITCVGASRSSGELLFDVLGRAPMRPRAAKQPRPPIETTRRRCAAAAVGSRSPPPVGHGEQRRLGRIRARVCLSVSEFSETPPKLSSAADPAQQGVHVGSPFFGVLFFGETKKSASAAGTNPRPPPFKEEQKEQSAATKQSLDRMDKADRQRPAPTGPQSRPPT